MKNYTATTPRYASTLHFYGMNGVRCVLQTVGCMIHTKYTVYLYAFCPEDHPRRIGGERGSLWQLTCSLRQLAGTHREEAVL
jgi:hypothetical protein